MQVVNVDKLKPNTEVEKRVVRYLESQGFQVTVKAHLTGKSGIEHTFDMLAKRDDGITEQTIAICIIVKGDKESEASAIFSFANKAYDVGIKERVLIAIPMVDPETKQLAEKQRIKVIDEEKIESLLLSKPEQKAAVQKPFKFENKGQIVEALVKMGYKVEEEAKVRGRSGVEYNFNILAYGNGSRIGNSLGIDIMAGEKDIDVEQVSLFDTKAYDVGLDDKVIALLKARLSDQARQFAEHQGIKVLELGQKPTVKPTAVELKASQSQKAPAWTTEEVVVETKSKKALRKMPQPEAILLIPEVLARRYNAIPLTVNGKTMEVAMADPTDILALEAFSVQSHMRIKPRAAEAREIRDAIDFNYKAYGEIERQISSIAITGDKADEKMALDAAIDAPLVQALNLIIDEAVKARASDVHIEPEEKRLRVRYRIDGTLQDMMSLPTDIHSALISRIKILSNLNIADHFRAQDGQFSTETKGRNIDVRVATSPTVHGEMSVLRLLDKSTATLGLSELGLLSDSLEKFEKMLKVPYGMILVSGPTGAGKTTTLYASVNSLDTMGRNIVTIEDPAEYRFEDINQIQVNPQAGITFASGLRSILRLDPDVILVGEIRDAETANIAVQAALTGHLMLSSIHANDTVGVLFRLIDLGVEPFLIASAVIGIMAQRMVRRVCTDCAQEIEAPMVERMAYEREIGKKRSKFLYAAGCGTCAYTGYRGRTGIFELLSMSDTIRRMLINGASSADIREQALKEGMVSMMNDGMRKVEEGITTPSEVLRSAYTVEQQL
jgi:general secretion pathway protein E